MKRPTADQLDQMAKDMAETARRSAFPTLVAQSYKIEPLARQLAAELRIYEKALP